MNKQKLKRFLLSNYSKFALGISLLYYSSFTVNAYGFPAVTDNGLILNDALSITRFTLTAVADNKNNNVNLNWDLDDASNKIFKVFKRKDGSNSFQSISTTNFESIEKVNVLNVYPDVGESITFTTYDNKSYTLPKAASLKMWMESPTSYIDEDGKTVDVPYGFGKGIISVTPVTIEEYNSNPDLYLKNSDGSYKHDVIMFGSWDSNNSTDLSQLSLNATKEFLDSGRGALFGHDTVRRKFANFCTLMEYANLQDCVDNIYYNGVASCGGFGYGEFYPKVSDITICRNGLLVNYPWLVGDIGSALQVPATHNSQASNGDIWMRFTHSNYSESDMNNAGNFYLATWNNTAMIQTGHSKGEATKDEQKLLANTLFYLNQLSTSTSLIDNDGQDVTPPELPKLTLSSANIDSATYSIESINDIGTNYEYYVIAEDKNGDTFQSNTVKTTVTSGLKGYSYVIDNSPNTEPDNNVNLESTVSNIKVNITDTNKEYYIHIKSIDNRDNSSETVHIKVDAPKLTATANNKENNVSLTWDLEDASNKVFKVYQKKEDSSEFQSISSTDFDSGKQVNVLNLYPTSPNIPILDTFTTWDNEVISGLPKSASLKLWMESPSSYVDKNTNEIIDVPKGYGRGLIEVTPVSIEDFNNNLDILKNSNGEWIFDVVYIGAWDNTAVDSNPNNLLTETAKIALFEFTDDGKGLLVGHDVVNNHPTKLWNAEFQSYLNIDPLDSKYVVGDNKVVLTKQGLLTNYPWSVGNKGDVLNIPVTHTGRFFAKGDIWFEYENPVHPGSAFNHSTLTLMTTEEGSNNHYLTTWNNFAMIQTGHSNGEATTDEQKILANTLFYLNQISTDTFLVDNSGQDVKAPDAPSVKLLASNSGELSFDFSETKDNGSAYEYYVVSEDKLGNILTSNTASATVTTGIKGYSYVLDKNPTTEPSNTVNHSSNTLTLNNIENNTTYYLHVKAIDNANNVSKTTHFKICSEAPVAPIINLSRTGWGTTDVTFTISQNHNKDVKILSLSTHSSTPFVTRLETLGYNVVSNPDLRNIDEISKYDIVVSDAYWWSVQNGAFLEELYNNGLKIITVGNDSGNSILPIVSSKNVGGDADLTMTRVIKNEATFALPSYLSSNDTSSNVITEAISGSITWYKMTSFDSPYVLSIHNGVGGEWIHSQSILGINNTRQSDEFIMGLIDYLTCSISQFHLQDVQYKINDGDWISYNGEEVVLSNEGNYTISVRNIDTRGVASELSTKIVGIDRTAPSGTASTSKTTTSRTITVTLSNLNDSLSGLNKVRISNYSDFRDSTGYTSIENKNSIDLKIELPYLSNLNDNYSSRVVYIELQDKVGNKKVLNCSTIYEPKAPTVEIIKPTNNTLVAKNELIHLSWNYIDNNNDNVVLPQSKAVITATKIDSNNSAPITITVVGTTTSAALPGLDTGEYSVTVTAYNSFDKYSTSEPIIIRCNTYKSTGYLNTISISVGSPLTFISVLSDVEIPLGTEIKGFVYYAVKESDCFDENKKIEFTLSNNELLPEIIRLPEPSSKIKIYYSLYNKTTNKQLSPALCHIRVLGK